MASRTPIFKASTTVDDWVRSDLYHNSHLIPQDTILEEALRNSEENGLPDIAVSAAQGKFLNLLVQSIQAQRILEIGTLGGYSTIWFARAIPDSGHITTLELSDKHAQVARQNFEKAGMANKITLIVGPAAQTLAALKPEKPYDLVFIDADKPSNLIYYTEAKRLVKKGGVIIVDNVVRNGWVANPDVSDNNIEGVRRLLKAIKDDHDVEASTISTVGEKGYDGFLYAIRK
ncbi:O-methyltransferase family 3 protein [Cyathus striatus]|nr:O-methyltransferase family 3 protein [Cyathus striatus]